MEKVVPLSSVVNTDTLLHKIVNELPEDVIYQIYLFHHRKEKENEKERDVAFCRSWISKHMFWFGFLGFITFQVIAFYIGAYITTEYGVEVILLNILVGYSCLALFILICLFIIMICLFIEKCCCTPRGYFDHGLIMIMSYWDYV